MFPSEPNFFKGRRLGLYFRGGRLFKDKKTDQRFWRLKWALTIHDRDAHSAGGAILSNYQQLQARENAVEKIEIAGCHSSMVAEIFDISDADAPRILRLDKCVIDTFSMTWVEGMTEFWLSLEHPLTDQLHKFVKDYAFQRFYVEFEGAQRTITEAIAERAAAAEADPDSPFNRLAQESGVSSTLLDGSGKVLAEFKPKGSKPN